MSKDKIKGFLAGTIVMTLIFSMTISVFAISGSKNITASYNNIKIYVNKELVTPKDANGNTVEPFIYNGTTYLPVRAVADALGQEVSWDNNTKSVYIGTQPASTPVANVNYSRNNPAPLNIPQTVNYSSYFDSYNATVSVTEITRGSSAWSKIKNANMFNDEPTSGHEYILVKIQVTMNSVKDDAAFSISQNNFTAFTSDNAEYPYYSVVKPEPVLEGQMYAGSTKEGYVVFEVKTDDATPKMVFGNRYDGTGGIWFKLY